MKDKDLIKDFIKTSLGLDFDISSLAIIALDNDVSSTNYLLGNSRDIVFGLEQAKQQLFDQLKKVEGAE